MSGLLAEVWLNVRGGPRNDDHYSTDSGDELEELPDRSVRIGAGFVAEANNVTWRKYVSGPVYLTCPECTARGIVSSFDRACELGAHRSKKHGVRGGGK